MKKRLVSIAVTALLTAGLLSGCGKSEEAAAGGTIKVAATSVPHAEILEAARPILEAVYMVPCLFSVHDNRFAGEACNLLFVFRSFL